MGKYSGILICSDFDGTLYDGKQIPENNMQAIRELREGGGLFTVVSGRTSEFLRDFFGEYKLGVPTVNYNGAVIYDLDNDIVVSESFMGGLTAELAKRCLAVSKSAINAIFCPPNKTIRIPVGSPELITQELCDNTYKYLIELPLDVSKEASEEDFKAIKEIVGDEYALVRSSHHLIELLDKRFTKASASLFLKEYTGAHTLICVGDFENDLDMIKAADIGYAVANAAESVKTAADRVTVSVKEGAIAAIMDDIKSGICKQNITI